MKKILVIMIAVSVFVLLYFSTGQQPNIVDQRVSDSASETNKPVKKIANKITPADNEIPELSSDLQNTQSSQKKLEPEIQQALEKMLNTSSDGLVEEKTDKSISVDLKGRFQTVPVATINEKGEVEIRDYNSAPKTEDK